MMMARIMTLWNKCMLKYKFYNGDNHPTTYDDFAPNKPILYIKDHEFSSSTKFSTNSVNATHEFWYRSSKWKTQEIIM